MSILEGLGDIRHTEDSEPFVRNMDDYNEMMNKQRVVNPMIKDNIAWGMFPAGTTYVAMDSDMWWWGYTSVPVLNRAKGSWESYGQRSLNAHGDAIGFEEINVNWSNGNLWYLCIAMNPLSINTSISVIDEEIDEEECRNESAEEVRDRWIHIRNLFMAEYCKTGIVSAEGMDGIQVNTDTFLDMFPEHEVNPWVLEGSQFTERLTAQYKGVTFFTIR